MNQRNVVIVAFPFLLAGCQERNTNNTIPDTTRAITTSGLDVASCLAESDTSFSEMVSVSYDRFTDSTTVSIRQRPSLLGLRLAALREARGEIDASDPAVFSSINCAGRIDCNPTFANLAIVSASADGRFANRPDQVIFLLDGETRVRLDVAAYRRNSERFVLWETIGVSVPYARFLQIVCADTVEYQVGDLEATLKPFEMYTLRELMRIVERGPLDSLVTEETN